MTVRARRRTRRELELELENGSLVPAALVARWTGRDVRTVRAWVANGDVPGAVLGSRRRRRYYVQRETALALKRGDVPPPSVPSIPTFSV